MVTVCAMSATIMQALDTTIANVALPYMQGSLSASLDQINWVLTSYIVASAIMTAPIGWVADRFGRKRLFIVCAAGFTFASLLCGLAQNIEQMVVFRLLQGMFGAALVPLSQAVMLDTYSAQERGSAMAIWGIGVMLGPIMGPTLGAWLTDNYSWHWVFLINLPIGIVTVLGLMVFMQETEAQARHALRLVRLHRARHRHRLAATDARPRRAARLVRLAEIIGETDRFDRRLLLFLRAFADDRRRRSCASSCSATAISSAGCLFMVVIGVVLFGTMALMTPFMQNVMGYPILTAGNLLAARGIGTLISMIMVGRLMKIIEARWLVLVGLVLAASRSTRWSASPIRPRRARSCTTGIVQGFGVGLVFVPLSTVAFTTLPGHLRTEGTAILTLVRNIGSSIGISVVIAELTSTTTLMHARLAENVTPFNNALQAPAGAMLDMATDTGRAMLDAIVTQQATIIAYDNDFKLLML